MWRLIAFASTVIDFCVSVFLTTAPRLFEIAGKGVLFCVSVILTTLTAMVVPLSTNASGQYDYSMPTAVLFAELLKLCASVSMLLLEGIRRHCFLGSDVDNGGPPLIGNRLETLQLLFRYIVPAFCWFVGNNLTFITLQAITPTANQVLGQSKVIFTVGLLYFLLRRRFSLYQIVSLVVLASALSIMALEASRLTHDLPTGVNTSANVTLNVTLNVSLSQRGAVRSRGSVFTVPPTIGIICSLSTALLGSLAGVYNEKLLKEVPMSIFFQNSLAYVWGCSFNLAYIFMNPQSRAIVIENGFLSGYNEFTWLYVVSVAAMGLSVSFIYKYLDNVARNFSAGTSNALTLVLSVPAFGHSISFGVVCSISVVFISLAAYYAFLPQELAGESAKSKSADVEALPKQASPKQAERQLAAPSPGEGTRLLQGR